MLSLGYWKGPKSVGSHSLAAGFSQGVVASLHPSRILGFINQTLKRFVSIKSCLLFSNAR